jgi:sugar-specific transcriptional regulator TrmB
VYPILENLKSLGLVVLEHKGFKQFYTATEPKKLEVLVEERKKKFHNALPDFNQLVNLQSHGDVIKQYEGLKAIKQVYENLITDIKPHQDYLIITDQEKWLNLDKDYFMDFTERRAKLPINIKMLQIESKTSRWFKQYEKNFNYQIKFLPKDTNLTVNLVITPQKLVIHQLTPPISAWVIENKSSIELHTQLFNVIWNLL